MLRRVTVGSFRCITSIPSSSSYTVRRLGLTQSRSISSNEDLSTKRARLLYQSKKRGILENDILIGEFAETNLSIMDAKTLEEYDKMINGDHMEWDLFYYVSGKKPAPPEVENTNAFALLKKFVDEKKKSESR